MRRRRHICRRRGSSRRSGGTRCGASAGGGRQRGTHTPEIETWTENSSDGIITNNKPQYEPDIYVGRSLGAKAREERVILPDGTETTLTEGERITNIQVIGGAGRIRQIDEIGNLMKMFPELDEFAWQKKKGIGYVDFEGESYKAELHWYEQPGTGKVKLKVKADYGGNWFYED